MRNLREYNFYIQNKKLKYTESFLVTLKKAAVSKEEVGGHR